VIYFIDCSIDCDADDHQGLPAVSVPVRQSAHNNLPQGLQLVGRYMDEGTLLAAAHLLERAFPRPSHAMRAPLA
jgi:aspartyl-tRNA(Asn)/glutamyl-tRNA(Gln) amidotransferase subunit A